MSKLKDLIPKGLIKAKGEFQVIDTRLTYAWLCERGRASATCLSRYLRLEGKRMTRGSWGTALA